MKNKCKGVALMAAMGVIWLLGTLAIVGTGVVMSDSDDQTVEQVAE